MHTPDPKEKQPSVIPPGEIALPSSPHSRAVVVFCDAGPLIGHLESGIPSSEQLLEGFLKIPFPDWEVTYSSDDSRVQTLLTASPNSMGTHPFSVMLRRTEDYLSADASPTTPLVSYEGLITYTFGNIGRSVFLNKFPQLVASVVERLENCLQEPTVREQRYASARDSARSFADDMTWVTNAVHRIDEAVDKVELPSNLTQFIIDATGAALKKLGGDGYYYEFETLNRARMFSFSSGESIALANVEICWRDEYDNAEYEDAMVVVATRSPTGPPFCTLLTSNSFNPPQQRELFRIIRNLTDTSESPPADSASY